VLLGVASRLCGDRGHCEQDRTHLANFTVGA
jgi:hypothetical protein